MNIGDIATKARDLVGTDSVQYPDANLLIDLNIWYQKIASWILESQQDVDFDDTNNTKYPIYTQAMAANQRDYPITQSLNILGIKRVDMTYDGENWFRAIAFDDAEDKRGFGPVSGATVQDVNVDNRYVKNQPRFDIKYGSLFIYPMATTADVANGATIQAEFSRSVCEFSLTNTDTPAGSGKLYVGASTLAAGTAIPGFDILFHPILAYGAASEFAGKFNMPQLPIFLQKLALYEIELKQHFSDKNRDFKLILRSNDTPEDLYYR